MKSCSKIAPLLPLYTGGDLTLAKMEMVAAHLAGCIDCARAAGELKDARIWLQSFAATEFGEETLLQLRQSIRRKVESQKKGIERWPWLKIYWRPAVLATAVVLIAGALVFSLWNRKPARMAKSYTPPPVVEVQQPPVKEPDDNLAGVNAHSRRRNLRLAHRVEVPAERQLAQTLPSETQPDNRPMVRLEIQTADPNIRIIWLTPAAAPVRN